MLIHFPKSRKCLARGNVMKCELQVFIGTEVFDCGVSGAWLKPPINAVKSDANYWRCPGTSIISRWNVFRARGIQTLAMSVPEISWYLCLTCLFREAHKKGQGLFQEADTDTTRVDLCLRWGAPAQMVGPGGDGLLVEKISQYVSWRRCGLNKNNDYRHRYQV